MVEGTGVGLSNTAGSLVVGAGAAVGGGREDGTRVLPYSSFVDRGTPAQLHSSYEEEVARSLMAFSSQSNWSTVGGSYSSSTHGSVPVATIAATHGLTSYPDASDATR